MNRHRTSQPAVQRDYIDAVARLLRGAAASGLFVLLSGCSSAPSRNVAADRGKASPQLSYLPQRKKFWKNQTVGW